MLSVVTTMYRSAPYLEEFYRRAAAAGSEGSDEVELIFVDDGSPDDSLRIARRFLGRDENVRLVVLSRNFGHHEAILAGLAHARGDLVFLIDCDLEEPPEMLSELRAAMLDAAPDDPVDVAYGVRRERHGSLVARLGGGLFYRLINAISGLEVPRDVTIARLMTRRYVDALLRHREKQMFILGLMTLTGFRQVGVPVDKQSKPSSTYTVRGRTELALKAIASFSDRPLTLIFQVGILVTLLAFLIMAAVGFNVVVLGQDYLTGWPSTLTLISFFGGMTLASIGIVGFYLGRVLLEVKDRPTIVKDVEANYPSDPDAAAAEYAVDRGAGP